MDETAQRLLGSATRLSRDPETEIDWDAPIGDGYGMSPEWSTLYGTPYWQELTGQAWLGSSNRSSPIVGFQRSDRRLFARPVRLGRGARETVVS
jgi:hypothetical protein